jgi:hypothetical protein
MSVSGSKGLKMKNKTIPVFLVTLFLLSSVALAYRNQAHTETNPTPITAELKENFIGQTDLSRWGRNFGLNIYLNFQLTARGREISLGGQQTQNQNQYSYYPKWGRDYKTEGYNVKSNEKVCVGEKLYVNQFTSEGEYYEKGGPSDSPPVRYVENLDDIKRQIEMRTYTTSTERIVICQWAVKDEREIGPQRCVIDGAVLCSNQCMLSAGENLRETGEGEYEVTGRGEARLEASCTPDCIVFVDRKKSEYTYSERDRESGMVNTVTLEPVYGYMELKDPQGKELTISRTFTMSAEEGYGPSLEIAAVHMPESAESGSEFVVRLEIENKGDMKANLDKIKLNVPGSRILYKPESLDKGKGSEILIQTRAENAGELKLDMDYSSEHISCLNTKDFSQTFSIGALNVVGEGKGCSTDTDCSAGETCCMGSCRPSSKGVCDDIDGDGEPDTWVEV